MSDNVLVGLANQLSDQFGLGENQNRSLDIATDGTSQRFGKLGDFAKQIDQSQERSYVQEGYLRVDQYNASPKAREILFQEPDITVLIKKRAFTALAENYQLDHMNSDEKLFYKATKILFANKCNQISAFERLSKIQRVSAQTGSLSAQLIPVVISLVDELNSSFSDFIPGADAANPDTVSSGTDPTSGGLTKLNSVIKQIKDVYSFSNSNFYTTWLVESSNLFKSKFGEGTGVIEFCNVSRINTNTSVSFEEGNFSCSISDPYNLMVITSSDIEKALSDATNLVYNSKIFQFGQDSVDSIIGANTKTLNDTRARRGASPIQFITNPNAFIGDKVSAIITGPGEAIRFTYDSAAGLAGIAPGMGGVVVSSESLIGGPDVRDEGLDTSGGSKSEMNLFSTVIDNIFTKLQLQQSSQSISQQNSSLTNYSRRKLRLHYLGKLCVQPMDQIHVYLGSKSRLDNKVLGGLQSSFTGLSVLQNLNNTAAGFKNQFDALFNPNGNSNFQLEKTMFVGSDFPNWLWTIMRNVFVNETSGVHVFGGVVRNSSSSYNDGSYTASFSGEDMTFYLKQGRINFKPAVDVFNGPLYDPLTPFKSSFDTVSNNFNSNQFELLDENKEILASKITKFKSGPLAGQLATEQNHNNIDSEHQNIGDIKQVFYSPDGLAYKWKEGIGTYTHLSNSLVIQGDSTIGNVAITVDPFAGQDIMNVISLSITGQPYNYNSFYKAAQQFDSFGRDPQTGADSAFSYYKSLTRDLTKNNLLWGNFIPFKSLVISESTYTKMVAGQLSINQSNDQVNSYLNKIQTLTDQLNFVNGTNDASTNNLKINLQQAIHVQQLGLQNQLDSINDQLQNNTGSQGLNLIGNDVSFDFDNYLNTNSISNTSLSQPNLRKDLRRKVNFLTRRLSWQVRSNEDKNLFIVDDSYDKDYDIQAFEKNLQSPELFNSEFDTVIQKINVAAKFLDLEVFCDTQGHIRCRPPQYNRMPSSVFYKLFQLKQKNGIQLFPQFLENLFVNQLQSLQTNLETIEDQIRLDGALLGAASDDSLYTIIRGVQGGQQSTTTVGSTQFTLLTNETTGKLSNFDQLYTESNPEVKIDLIDNTIEGELNSQAGITSVFTSEQRSQFLVSTVSNPLLKNSSFYDPSLNGSLFDTQNTQTRIDTLKSRLFTSTGQQVNIDEFYVNNYSLADAAGITSTNTSSKKPDLFKISNDLSSKISQRQTLVKQLEKALNNAKESISLDSTNGQQTANRLLMPDISPNSSIPEVFENLIEDESYDDLGPNSGKRYIIEDYQIKSFNIDENPPDFTVLEVHGHLDPSLFINNSDLPQNTGSFTTNGGNSLVSAAAVDYDMWRMYGFINTSSIDAPFFSNPETQCAPYAAIMLNRARKNILRGNLTITGNEYMQPGDVIYLRSRDLLFYVNSVNHSFSYNSGFSTTLQLSYGHTAGEYIPTPLDSIGKLLYNNRDSTSYINRRQGNSFNQENVGVLILDKRTDITTDTRTKLLSGTYGDQNIKVLNNILYTTYFAILSNKDPNSIVKPNIELRLYYDSKGSQTQVDSTILEAATIARQILIGIYDYPGQEIIKNNNQTLSPDDVVDPKVSVVDISGIKESRSPSQKAVDMVRNISSTASSSDGNNSSQINSTLFGYIIDVWITFNNTSTTGQD